MGKKPIAIPTADATAFTYNGTEQTYALAEDGAYTITGNKQTNANETGYVRAVEWMLKRKVTQGTTDTTFSPNLNCTRAQIVTFLLRAAGSPEPKGTVSFADVPAGSYYAKAVAWAVENGISPQRRARGVKFGRPRKALPEGLGEVKARWERGELSARAAGKLLSVTHRRFLLWVQDDGCKEIVKKTQKVKKGWIKSTLF